MTAEREIRKVRLRGLINGSRCCEQSAHLIALFRKMMTQLSQCGHLTPANRNGNIPLCGEAICCCRTVGVPSDQHRGGLGGDEG